MKKILIIAFLFLFTQATSQTKDELINQIIEKNSVESNCIGYGCMPSEQYARFEKLKRLLSESELYALGSHKNPVIRSYALKELAKRKHAKLPQFLTSELEKNEEVSTFEGCLIDAKLTASILYHEYWNHIRFKAMRVNSGNNYEKELAAKKKLQSDSLMEQLDSVIIHSNQEVYWLLYHRVFENRKHKDAYLPRIEQLAFEKHNFYAFNYLKRKYEIYYRDRLHAYLINIFPKAHFQSENNKTYFIRFIKHLLETEKPEYKTAAIQALKNTNFSFRSSFQEFLKGYQIDLKAME
jgi:hypothetical protein